MKKRISKKTAREVYGIITSGASSLNTFYLLEDGTVVDDTGSVRYIPQKKEGTEE